VMIEIRRRQWCIMQSNLNGKEMEDQEDEHWLGGNESFISETTQSCQTLGYFHYIHQLPSVYS